MNREERIEFAAHVWFNSGDHTEDGILETYAKGIRHAEDYPDSDYAWALYNFINEWKAGKFDIITLQDAINTKFKTFYESWRNEKGRI